MITCSVDVCDRAVAARGFCLPHYKRWQKGKPLAAAIRSPQECAVDACSTVVRTNQVPPLCTSHSKRRRSGNLGAPRSVHQRASACRFQGCDLTARSFELCPGHYAQRREGRPLAPLRRPAGRMVVSSGYVQLYRPDLGWTSSGWVMEHRAVMADLLGRELLADESVHHRNGDRLDNRPANLELWSSSQPAGQRVVDKVAWAVELLGLYAPDRLTA